MTEKEAMKLALEALEVATTPLANDRQEVLRAQAALREALAEHPAQGCEYCNHPLYAGTKCKNCGRVTEQAAIKQDLTPEQPAQQEPIAYAVYHRMGGSKSLHWSEQHSPDGDASQYQLVPLFTSPAQRKPLTDDPLQGAVDWLLEADGEYFCTATVQRTLRIGYNRAKRLCDTAKERAAHGIKENT